MSNPKTFRPASDVERELKAADALGYRQSWIINQALRQWFMLPAFEAGPRVRSGNKTPDAVKTQERKRLGNVGGKFEKGTK